MYPIEVNGSPIEPNNFAVKLFKSQVMIVKQCLREISMIYVGATVEKRPCQAAAITGELIRKPELYSYCTQENFGRGKNW